MYYKTKHRCFYSDLSTVKRLKCVILRLHSLFDRNSAGNGSTNHGVVSEIKAIISKLNFFESFKNKIDDIKRLFSSFELAWNQNTVTGENSVSLKVSPSDNISEKMVSFRELMLFLGEVAKESEISICLFVDEIQYMNKDDLAILIEVLHRIAQRNLPIGF